MTSIPKRGIVHADLDRPAPLPIATKPIGYNFFLSGRRSSCYVLPNGPRVCYPQRTGHNIEIALIPVDLLFNGPFTSVAHVLRQSQSRHPQSAAPRIHMTADHDRGPTLCYVYVP